MILAINPRAVYVKPHDDIGWFHPREIDYVDPVGRARVADCVDQVYQLLRYWRHNEAMPSEDHLIVVCMDPAQRRQLLETNYPYSKDSSQRSKEEKIDMECMLQAYRHLALNTDVAEKMLETLTERCTKSTFMRLLPEDYSVVFDYADALWGGHSWLKDAAFPAQNWMGSILELIRAELLIRERFDRDVVIWNSPCEYRKIHKGMCDADGYVSFYAECHAEDFAKLSSYEPFENWMERELLVEGGFLSDYAVDIMACTRLDHVLLHIAGKLEPSEE